MFCTMSLRYSGVREMRLVEGEVHVSGPKHTAATDFVARQPHEEGPGLPVCVLYGDYAPNKQVIGWMSANSEREKT